MVHRHLWKPVKGSCCNFTCAEYMHPVPSPPLRYHHGSYFQAHWPISAVAVLHIPRLQRIHSAATSPELRIFNYRLSRAHLSMVLLQLHLCWAHATYGRSHAFCTKHINSALCRPHPPKMVHRHLWKPVKGSCCNFTSAEVYRQTPIFHFWSCCNFTSAEYRQPIPSLWSCCNFTCAEVPPRQLL